MARIPGPFWCRPVMGFFMERLRRAGAGRAPMIMARCSGPPPRGYSPGFTHSQAGTAPRILMGAWRKQAMGLSTELLKRAALADMAQFSGFPPTALSPSIIPSTGPMVRGHLVAWSWPMTESYTEQPSEAERSAAAPCFGLHPPADLRWFNRCQRHIRA